MRGWILAWLLAAPAAWSQPQRPADPCPAGTAVGTLEGLDVRARLFTNGNLFYGPGFTRGDGYEVPTHPGHPDANKSPLFATALWLGGIVGGEVRAPSARYANFPFRPGATGPDGTPPTPAECAAADRIWTVSREDVTAYLTDGTLTDDLRDWPAALGAPVLDGDGVAGNYDLAGGDQPAIRGDVTAFWAMTDLATGRPSEFFGLPLGVDIGVEAFAFRRPPFAATVDKPMATTTLYRFTVTNRAGLPIDSAYVGFFADTDLGNAVDDYVGTDTTHAMTFAYNTDDDDDGSTGYGAVPAFGMAVVESPVGTGGQPLGLTSTQLIYESNGPTSDPFDFQQVYYRMQGLWNDGTRMREGGNGYGPQAGSITTFTYAGDPVTESYWSEVNNDGSGQDNAGGDRSGSFSTGPFRLAPGASASWTVALLFGQGDDRFDSVVDLRRHADQVHSLQAAGLFEPQHVTVDIAPAAPSPFTVRRAAPNPFTATTRIDMLGLAGQSVTVRVVDVLGREVERQTLVPAGDAASVTVGAGLAAGVYVVEVAGPGFTVPLTIAKTR